MFKFRCKGVNWPNFENSPLKCLIIKCPSPRHYVSSLMDGGCFCFCLDFRLTEKSNRPVMTLLQSVDRTPSIKIRAPKNLFICDPEIEIFFAITPEILK